MGSCTSCLSQYFSKSRSDGQKVSHSIIPKKKGGGVRNKNTKDDLPNHQPKKELHLNELPVWEKIEAGTDKILLQNIKQQKEKKGVINILLKEDSPHKAGNESPKKEYGQKHVRFLLGQIKSDLKININNPYSPKEERNAPDDKSEQQGTREEKVVKEADEDGNNRSEEDKISIHGNLGTPQNKDLGSNPKVLKSGNRMSSLEHSGRVDSPQINLEQLDESSKKNRSTIKFKNYFLLIQENGIKSKVPLLSQTTDKSTLLQKRNILCSESISTSPVTDKKGSLSPRKNICKNKNASPPAQAKSNRFLSKLILQI